MIFILKESAFNGSVTMSTNVMGISAPDFETAKAILKSSSTLRMYEKRGTLTWSEEPDLLTYQIYEGVYPLIGTLDMKPLEFLDDER